MKTAEGNKWIQTKTFCADHCQVGEGPHLINTITTSGGSTISIYCNGNVEIHDVDNEVIDPAILNGIGEIMGDATIVQWRSSFIISRRSKWTNT